MRYLRYLNTGVRIKTKSRRTKRAPRLRFASRGELPDPSTWLRTGAGDCPTPGDYASKWDFAYDGDGVRVATLTTPYENGLPQTPSLTAYYFGGMYEVTGNDVRKYYSFGGQTVAMHDPSAGSGQAGLQYFLSDHLGSIVAVTDANGTLINHQRYLPFGGVREIVGKSPKPITATPVNATWILALD